jgi:hypothetical protein
LLHVLVPGDMSDYTRLYDTCTERLPALPLLRLIGECRAGFCGDGLWEATAGEECDMGPANGGAACRANCTVPMCGDEIVDTASGEDCDPPGGSCTSSCVEDPCATLDCGSHGTCNSGVCTCSSGYRGERCERLCCSRQSNCLCCSNCHCVCGVTCGGGAGLGRCDSIYPPHPDGTTSWDRGCDRTC